MVGFGSSLRMSRRRGWEDAYLDYQSLRLLLTQIEAVYEEEDWKHAGGGSENEVGSGSAVDLYGMDNSLARDVIVSASVSEDAGDGMGSGWRGLWDSAVRVASFVAGSGYSDTERRSYYRRRRGDANAAATGWAEAGETECDDYFDYSREQSRHRAANARNKRKKDKDGHDRRALDRGGWRSRTDYRDELFLVSDDDVAYGCYYSENGDECEEENDEDDWEDEEDSIEDDEDDKRYYDSEVGQYDANVGSSNSNEEENSNKSDRGLIDAKNDADMQMNSKKLTPGSTNPQSEGEEDCKTPPSSSEVQGINRNSNKNRLLFGSSNLLQTPSQHSPLPTNGDKPIVGHRVQFSDSPGVLEAGYETFAAAAARRGFTSPGIGGDGQVTMNLTAGSPSEQRGGWFDFIPSLLGKKQQQQEEEQQRGDAAAEDDPLIRHFRRHSSEDDNFPSLNRSLEYSPGPNSASVEVTSDHPHRYTHFSEKFAGNNNRSASGKSVPGLSLGRRPTPSPPNLHEEGPTGDGKLSSTSQLAVALGDGGRSEMDSLATLEPRPIVPLTPIESTPEYHIPQATAVGGTMPDTPMESPVAPMTPPITPISVRLKRFDNDVQGKADNRVGSFGVSLKMLPTESSELLVRPSSPRKTKTPAQPSNVGMSHFYSFQNDEGDDNCNYYHLSTNDDGGLGYSSTVHQSNNFVSAGHDEDEGAYDGGDEVGRERCSSNMISFYSGGNRDGYFSVRSPTKRNSAAAGGGAPQHHTRLSSFSSVKKLAGGDGGGKFILSFLFGNDPVEGRNKTASNMGQSSRVNVAVRGGASTSERARLNKHRHHRRQKRAAAAEKRKRARLRRQRQIRRRRERVPEHLRVAHTRAAAITERFRGLLRAEVEKVILFANSRLGELSDTIGSLRYSSYEDGQEEMRKKYPSLADGGMHDASSSDSDGGDSIASSISGDQGETSAGGSNPPQRARGTSSSNDDTKKQIMLRDRLRISRPLFSKADFLGEDFSLLSAVDEADAYAAVGVELMHLLKYVCVNIIAIRKICRKHDKLLDNRMLGGYYQRLASKSLGNKQNELIHETHPQLGGTLSSQTAAHSAGHILGIYDTKIQHIANSTTMQTVSSSLAIALSEAEASQSRSALTIGFGSKSEAAEPVKFSDLPTPKHRTTRQHLSYQLGGHCFRGEDESTVASNDDQGDENESTSSNAALTRLQFVVTSIFGLREAARFKSVPFEHYASRLFMASTGPNVLGDGLDGCSRETLDFLCSYQPDAAYTLDMETLCNALKVVGRGKDGIGGVMVASLAAAAEGYEMQNTTRFHRQVASAMSINPRATGTGNGVGSTDTPYQHILRLNALSMILYSFNYYCIVPTSHLTALTLGSRSSAAALIGVANVSSILSSFIHTMILSKRKSFVRRRAEASDFRIPFILCSAFAFIGNVLYSTSLTRGSLGMAVISRILVGLGCAEVLNRQLLTLILPQESINVELAKMAKLSMLTIPMSLLFGALIDIKVNDRRGFVNQRDNLIPMLADPLLTTMPSATPVDSMALETVPAQPFIPAFVPNMPFGQRNLFTLQSVGYVMAFAWFVHLVGMIAFFHPPKSRRKREREAPRVMESLAQEEDFDSDTEQSPFISTETNPFIASEKMGHGDGTFEKLQTMSRKLVKNHSHHSYSESIAEVRNLLFSNVAFPTALAVLFVMRMAGEILISSCPTITARYFDWSGARSGLFVGVMASMILPINISLASDQHNFTERSIMKTSLVIARYGFALMLNYESIIRFFISICHGSLPTRRDVYDGLFGAPQYMLSFAVVFTSIVFGESVTLTLMAKVQVAHRQIKKYSIDSSFVVIFISAVSRIVGDGLITIFDISSWAFFNDIVNSLCFSLVIIFTVGILVVRRHYFFLI